MTKITIEIECDNAAFGESYPEICQEAARIVLEAANKIAAGYIHAGERLTLRDANGNRVGFVQMPSDAA